MIWPMSLILSLGLQRHISERNTWESTWHCIGGNSLILQSYSVDPQIHGKTGCYKERGLGQKLEISFQSRLCCQQAIKTLSPLVHYLFTVDTLPISKTDWKWLSIKTTNVSELFYKVITQIKKQLRQRKLQQQI